MCGIGGLIGGSPHHHPQAAQRLGQALAHRGPDDAGLWQDPSGSAPALTLVHRRLAIQDLSPAGHQPMQSGCGRYILVFNGEIYNQRQLRSRLEQRGHRFRSSSDTEVLLQLLIRYGPAALQQLRGMYAFCLWDRQARTALLARDPFGIKPLLFWQGPGGELLFASELRALLASALVPRRLDPAALAAFLAAGSLPETATLVEGVSSLPPGCLARWQAGALQIQPHWRPPQSVARSSSTVAFAGATSGCPRLAVRAALQASLKAHLLSDVPVGLFLSGGLDSATLLALSHPRCATLTIGFAESRFDESGRAAALARHFGSHHTEFRVDPAQAAALLPAFLAAVDQPSVDGFNTFCVARLAAAQGLKVVLSGLGGDELFGGYPSFQRIPRLLQLHARLGPSRAAAARALALSPHHQRQRLAAFLRGPGTVAAAHACLRGLFAPAEVARLLQHWGLPVADPPLPAIEPPAETPCLAEAIAALESRQYMGCQLLRDSDTYAMAHGLELRLPFVDAALSEALAALPARTRLAPGKRLLRQAMPELGAPLPAAPKQGFSFPFPLWFSQPHAPFGPGSAAFPLLPCPADLDLSPWSRRWALMVLRHWLAANLSLELG